MTKQILSGEIVEDDLSMSLSQLSRVCCVEESYIIELVSEGILEPVDYSRMNSQPEQWYFVGDYMRLIKLSTRLQSDLSLNLAGVALILELTENNKTC